MRSQIRGPRRGFAIFISIGVLALLSVLASSFAIMTQMERSIANSFVDRARAKLLAEAGVDYAVGRLQQMARSQSYEDNLGAWYYGDGPRVDIGNSTLPSFRPSATPVLQLCPTTFGYYTGNNRFSPTAAPIRSGELAATYAGGNDIYILKVLDTAGQVDLNQTNPNVATILENLGNAINYFDSVPNPIPAGRGTDIVNLRNSRGGRFYAKYELLELPWMTRQMFDDLKDYICVACYRDTQAVLPRANASYPAGDYKPTDPAVAYPNGWIGRAPMNINTAPRPVLATWAQGVFGNRMTTPTNSSGFQVTAWSKAGTTPISQGQARAIANAIVSRRASRPFRCVDDVTHLFLNPYWGSPLAPSRDPLQGYDMNHDPSINLGVDQAMAMRANANPSLSTNKFFGSAATWNAVDKTDLVSYTWEVCFSSMGYFEIESSGRVLAPGQVVRAEARMKTVARVYQVFRQTTQREFLGVPTTELPRGAQAPPVMSQAQTWPENLASYNTPSRWEGGLSMSTAGAVIPPEWSQGVGTANAWAWLKLAYNWTGTVGVADPSTASNNRNAAASLYGSTAPAIPPADLTPEGALFTGNDPSRSKRLTYTMRTVPTQDQGALEFWVKLTTEPTVGSGEPLLYLVTTGRKQGPLYTGECVKIERFGTRLYCTRFFWGYPSPEISPYYMLLLDYELGDVSRWHAGTWHHVAVEWRDEVAPPISDIIFNSDDGTLNGGESLAQWRSRAQNGGTNMWYWIDGQMQGGMFKRWAEKRRYWFQGSVWGTLERRVKLTSKIPPPNGAPYPLTQIDLGEFQFDSSGEQIFYGSGLVSLPAGNNIWRCSNCVIDDLKVYANGLTWAQGTGQYGSSWNFPPERYRANGSTTFQQTFDLGALRSAGKVSPSAVLGTISWPTSQPAYGAGVPPSQAEKWLWRTPGSDQSPDVTCWWQVGTYSSSTEGAALQTSGSMGEPLFNVPMRRSSGAAIAVGTNSTLTYRLAFRNVGNLVPLSSTPVVDEVGISIIDSPRFVTCEWN